MKTLLLAVVLSLGFFMSSSAQGLTSTASHNVTLTLSNQLEIAFTAGGTGTSLTFSSPDDYTNGVATTGGGGGTLQVRSNRAYTVDVKAAAANFTTTSGTPMAVADVLKVKNATVTGSTFAAITATGAQIATGARGTNSFSVDYQATPGFAYNAGSYVASIVYTATQQ